MDSRYYINKFPIIMFSGGGGGRHVMRPKFLPTPRMSNVIWGIKMVSSMLLSRTYRTHLVQSFQYSHICAMAVLLF